MSRQQHQFNVLATAFREAIHRPIVVGDINSWNNARFAEMTPVTVRVPRPGNHASRPVGAINRFIIDGAVQVLDAHVHSSELTRSTFNHLPVLMDFERVGTS